MAVLDRETFFNALHERVGNDTSEEALTFLENMTDTYNDMSKRATGDGTDWKAKFEENDKAWRDKYKHRFFNSDGGNPAPIQHIADEEEYNPEGVTFDDLFKKKGD